MTTKNKFLLGFILIGITTLQMAAQNTLSLKQCLDFALEYNKEIKIAGYDITVKEKKVNEQKSGFLPQVSVSGTVEDNIKQSTQIMPGEMFGGASGTYIPISMGTQYSMSAGAKLNQTLINPALWIGIQSSKINQKLSVLNYDLTHQQVEYTISLQFYQTLIIKKQISILESTLASSAESLKSLKNRFENGMARSIDVDKLEISFQNTVSLIEQTKLSYHQSLNNLKYQMGMPVDSAIDIVSAIDSNITIYNLSDSSQFLDKRIDYLIQETNLQLAELDVKRNKAAYLPTLSFYGNYTITGNNEEFKFMNASQNWYKSSSIGLQLSIPVFSGFKNSSMVYQSTLNSSIAKERLALKEQSVKVELSNYEIAYKNALDNIKNEQKNLELSQRVFKETQLELKQGISSASDMVQAENSLRESQNNYFNKLLNLYVSIINFEQSKGTLKNFIESQK